jgi:hypothetical protein
MIAIGLLFIRMLCDCFKPRQRLPALPTDRSRGSSHASP